MHDIKFIRENPAEFDAAMQKRNETIKAEDICLLDKDLRQLQGELQELQTKRNEIAKAIGKAKSQGESAEDLFAQSNQLKQDLPALEEKITNLQNKLTQHLISLPNIPNKDVPVGKDEDDNVEIRKWGSIKEINFNAKQHFELGEASGNMDFETAAAMSGSRFVLLKSDIAKLERSIANFMLDTHTKEFDYTEVSPPTLVKDHAMFGVGQLPKFAEDSFSTTNGYRLIPTAEVSLTNIVANKILSEEELPLRFTAYTHCYRSEAGSAGRDTRGMIRLHQFSKVELVSIVRPIRAEEEHERMTQAAESILQKLDLPYRTMLLSSGDMGFSATKTYDLEVWLPGQKQYREISSCSNCNDFQARRMKARYKDGQTGKNHFLHTLNGSGLAVGRTLVAILENYQNEDGSISIPEVLIPYMGCNRIG